MGSCKDAMPQCRSNHFPLIDAQALEERHQHWDNEERTLLMFEPWYCSI